MAGKVGAPRGSWPKCPARRCPGQPSPGSVGPVLTLYQAEWCPFSSAVREILSELGLDFVARQVEAWPEDRAGLRAVFGSDEIPILETENGRFFVGTRAIYGYLRELEGWGYAAEHRGRFLAHLPARESDSVGRLVEHFHRPDHVASGAQ